MAIPQNNKSSRDKGSRAEDLAEKYLIDKGYEIIKRNFHFGRTGEIDIIAKDKDVLVFVEVKSRSNDSYGGALESITKRKQANLKKVAEGYFYVNKLEDKECRFDVVAIENSGDNTKIEHYKAAFY
jgi:putative endonuclease